MEWMLNCALVKTAKQMQYCSTEDTSGEVKNDAKMGGGRQLLKLLTGCVAHIISMLTYQPTQYLWHMKNRCFSTN